jgi:uncharacterized membrane protein YecN with MAPEG domain
MQLPISLFYGSMLGLILIHLSWGVSKNRMRAQVSLGTGGDRTLEMAIRAHGNFIEYVPMALILLILVEQTGMKTAVLHAIGGALVLGRILHAYGMRNPDNTIEARKWGTTITWLLILLTSLYNIGYFLVASF